MILQIACRSGVPPSVIAESWSPYEIQMAESLASLEGWGQEKRRTAMLAAEIHNAQRLAIYAQHGRKGDPLPKLLSESTFLPRRVRAAKQVVTRAKNEKKLASVMNAMCGY